MAASEIAFVTLKIVGAVVLVYLGVQSLRRAGAREDHSRAQRAFRDGVVTSLANPKLAVFFVALFPQFVGKRGNILANTLLMAAMIVASTASGTAPWQCWPAAPRRASCAAAGAAGWSGPPAGC